MLRSNRRVSPVPADFASCSATEAWRIATFACVPRSTCVKPSAKNTSTDRARQHEALAEQAAERVHLEFRMGVVGEAQRDRELVGAEPAGQRIGEAARQALGECHQQRVADIVPGGGVDFVEFLDVELDHEHPLRLAVLQSGGEQLGEMLAVRQAGERIRIGEAMQRLGRFAGAPTRRGMTET